MDDRLVSVPWWRVHTIANCAALVFFPHFRRYTRRLQTCRNSLSLSQIGRAVRGSCALLLPNVKRINMTSGERVLWFVWNCRLDGEGSLSLNGEIGQIPSSAIVTPHQRLRRSLTGTLGARGSPSHHTGDPDVGPSHHNVTQVYMKATSLVRYVILAISVAKIDFIVSMASLGVK